MELKVSRRSHLDDVEIKLTGAKNALLHLLFASLLPTRKTVFSNVSTTLHDYHAVSDILHFVGAKLTKIDDQTVEITPTLKNNQHQIISLDYTKKTRTSLMLLGVLTKKVKKVTIGYPGGCSFSDQRPFDIHLDGFKALGAKVHVDEYHISVTHQCDQDSEFTMRYPSVGASINLMFFAVIGRAYISLHNIALEPEVIEVASYLNQCGGKIRIDHKTRSMHIEGVKKLNGVNFPVMYDRIQTMTYGALAYLHRINVSIIDVNTEEYITAPLKVLDAIGAKWQFNAAKQRITFLGRDSRLSGTKVIAKPYPNFPTDLQPIFAVMLACANKQSTVQDKVYPERVKYVRELQKLNFPIQFRENKILINPLKNHTLRAAAMESFDLRAGMAVVMAASMCSQVCTISNAQEVFRGYEHLLENLTHFMHIAMATEYFE